MISLTNIPLKTPLISTLLLLLSQPVFGKDTNYTFISSEKDNNVIVLDADYKVIKKIATSDRPRHLAFTSDKEQIYVACGDGEAIDIISIADLEVSDSIEDIDDPEAFDLSPDGKLMYLSLEDDGALGIIDLKEKSLIKTVEVGEEPEGVLTHPDGSKVYVTSEVANAVHVVNTSDWSLAANIIVGKRPRRLALNPDQTELWVTSELDASVSIIDPKTNSIKEVIKFEPKGFRSEQVTPVGITMTADGKTVYVALGRANHIAIVDAKSRNIEDYILVGERAWNTALTKDESKLLVVNGLSDDLSIIDTAKRKVIKSLPVGRVPYMALIDD